MAEGDGKVVIDTELDSSGAKDGIKGLSSSIASSVGGAVKSIAKIGTAAVAAGATATAALVKSSVDAYASYEQLRGGIETLFGAGGQSAKEYAKSVGKSTDEAKKDYQQLMNAQNIALKNADKAYKTAGMSANDYMETVTSFAASLKQSTKNETEAAKSANQIVVDMSDNANKMGTDMTMIQNAYNGFAKQNYTMLDNLKLGYGGTQAEMQRLLEDAEKLSGQHYELGNFKDMAEAIHVVQTEMGITGTTAKEASTTIEGSVNSAKAAWTNLVSGMSQDNADMDKLINEFIDSVGVAAGNILPRIETALGGIGSLIEKLLPVIVDAIPGLIESLLPNLLSSGTNIVLTLIQGIAAAIPSLLSVLPEIISTIGTSLAEAGPQLFTSISEVLNQLLTFLLEQIPEFFNSISEFFSGDGAANIMDMLLTLFDNIATGIINNLPTLLNSLINMRAQILIFLATQIPGIVSTVVSMIPAIVNGLLQAIPTLIQAIPPIITALVNGLLDCIPDIIDAGVELIGALVDNLPEIINTIVEVIPEIITNLINAVLDHLPNIINAGFKLITALVKALPQIIITIVKAIPKIITGIIGALIGAIPKIITTGVKLLGSIIKNLPQIIAKVITAIPTIIKALIDGFGDCLGDMADIGLNLVKGLWNGIKDADAWLRDKISGFFGGVVNSIKDFFGIASPSKLMRDQIGKFIAQGIWVGFNEEDPMSQINRDLRYGMKKLDTTMTLSGGYYSGIDYDKMAQATTDAFVDANIGVSVGNRQFGRLVREVRV
jgi:phage-related protein